MSDANHAGEIWPTYANDFTFLAAARAVGSILNAVDAIMVEKVNTNFKQSL